MFEASPPRARAGLLLISEFWVACCGYLSLGGGSWIWVSCSRFQVFGCVHRDVNFGV